MPYPPSLFKDGLMRRADKAALRRAIMSDDEAVGKDQIDENSYVVDGGALLHRGRWFKDSTFNALAQLYVSYIRRHYSFAHVIFGVYKYASTKSNDELLIKSAQILKCLLSIPTTQDRFLSNDKAQFIDLISESLRKDGQHVTSCDDTQIVETAINLSASTPNPI